MKKKITRLNVWGNIGGHKQNLLHQYGLKNVTSSVAEVSPARVLHEKKPDCMTAAVMDANPQIFNKSELRPTLVEGGILPWKE